jgi:hypothetical protein
VPGAGPGTKVQSLPLFFLSFLLHVFFRFFIFTLLQKFAQVLANFRMLFDDLKKIDDELDVALFMLFQVEHLLDTVCYRLTAIIAEPTLAHLLIEPLRTRSSVF